MMALGPGVAISNGFLVLSRKHPPYPLVLRKLFSVWQADDVEPLVYYVSASDDQVTVHAIDGKEAVVLDLLETAAKVKRNGTIPAPPDFDPALGPWWREWVERFLSDEFALTEDENGATLTVTEMQVVSDK